MDSGRKKNSDEYYEKPSKHKQWQEKSERPIASRTMTKDDIEEHRRHLIQSYQCEDTDITYEFLKITDENDEDRDDCLWLKYKMKCVVSGAPVVRDIFSIKLPIPEDIRRMANEMRKQQASRTPAQRKPVKSIMSEQPLDTAPRPKLRKPISLAQK